MVFSKSSSPTGKILSTGDWVEVLSKEQILQTLDENGCLDGMPFMPEMLAYTGQRFRVFRRAHKTCDTVNRTGGRRVKDAVHLEEGRCSGASHGGCEAGCLIFWKTQWLRQVDGPDGANPRMVGPSSAACGVSESGLMAAVRVGGSDEEPVFRCQATQLPAATTPLKWWNFRQYAEDVTSGNESFVEMLRGATYVFVFNLIKAAARRTRVQRMAIALYDRIQRLRGGVPYPRKRGRIPVGEKTPVRDLDLAPGEVVRILSYDDILGTLDENNKNRGLYFDAEEVPFCGKAFRVRSRVTRIIDERSGKMIPIKGKSVILDGVWCKGHYSDRRMYCPRAIYPILRETWLERVEHAAKSGEHQGLETGVAASRPSPPDDQGGPVRSDS
jgi:hypothetical protein